MAQMSEETKKQIDEMDYQQMLYKWRFSPVGSHWFQGEVGDYFTKVMNEKRAAVGSEAHTAASKEIGW